MDMIKPGFALAANFAAHQAQEWEQEFCIELTSARESSDSWSDNIGIRMW